MFKKDDFFDKLLLWYKNQTRKITKHLLHCFYFELANQTLRKFLYLDNQYFLFLDVPSQKHRNTIILSTNRRKMILPAACTTKN